jgi:hypothetical protein
MGDYIDSEKVDTFVSDQDDIEQEEELKREKPNNSEELEIEENFPKHTSIEDEQFNSRKFGTLFG